MNTDFDRAVEAMHALAEYSPLVAKETYPMTRQERIEYRRWHTVVIALRWVPTRYQRVTLQRYIMSLNKSQRIPCRQFVKSRIGVGR